LSGTEGAVRSAPVEYLEIERREGTAVFPLEGSRVTLGSHPSNDVAFEDDPYLSRMHAVLERYPAGWLIRDLGSRNGTHVNGERIAAERMLRPGDAVLVGHTSVSFQSDAAGVRVTQASQAVSEQPREAASFVCEGDYWTLVFSERTSRVRDSKGMNYLARLLAAPGRELHVLDLASTVEGSEVGRARLGNAGEVLDAQAKAKYRQRLGDLSEELEEAQAFNDPERAARASQEIDALTDQLASAVGLGGRDRRAASATERARLNVTRAVRAAVRRIAEADERAGRHLEACLRTGVFCQYRPDPAAPTTWRISEG